MASSGVAPPSGGGAAAAVGNAALHGAQRGAAIAQKGVVNLTIYVQRNPTIVSALCCLVGVALSVISVLSIIGVPVDPDPEWCPIDDLAETGEWLVEEAKIGMPPGRGSVDAVSQSSSRSSPSLDMAEKSDVEDVNDRSMSIEGIPDLELIRASPVPVSREGYSGGVAPPELPNPSSLQLPKAKNYVPARAWGSTATVDPSKEDVSPGSPLKARRTYRRHQTMTAGPGQQETQPEEVNERRIKSLEGQKIYDVYYWEEVIQEDGDGGKVVVCRKKTEDNTGDFDKVMKIKSKLKLKKEGCADDYRKVLTKMLSLPAHPGVMPVEEALEDDAFYYVVTPRATSSFFDGLLVEFHDGVVPECALRSLMTDMLEAVDHLHTHGVLHRDIKPDNMVLQTHVNEETGEKRRRVVLIDFDHADPDFHNNPDDQERIYGTRRFNAPESYLCSFSKQTDLYSIGVIFYMLMTGKMPYDDEIFDGIKPPGSRMVSPRALLHDTFQRLKDADIDWNCDPWPSQPRVRPWAIFGFWTEPWLPGDLEQQLRWLSCDNLDAY
eukprot:s27_g16.t2